MKLKLTALILALVCCFALSACKADEKPPAEAAPEASISAPVSEPETGAEEAETSEEVAEPEASTDADMEPGFEEVFVDEVEPG